MVTIGTNYYVRGSCQNPCEHCPEDGGLVHLGKSSLGWTFSFKGRASWFRGADVDPFGDWLKLAESGPIENEYGMEIPLKDLLVLISRKAADPVNKRHAAEYPRDSQLYEGHSYTLSEFH